MKNEMKICWIMRYDIIASVAAILQLHGLSSPSSNQELVKVILYGDERLPNEFNKKLLEATLKFIHATERFKNVSAASHRRYFPLLY